MKNYKFTIHGTTYNVEIKNTEGQVLQLEVNGTPYEVTVDKEVKTLKTPKLVVNKTVPPADHTPQIAKTNSGSSNSSIKSPLPGTILDVFVKVGDAVSVGQKVLLLEAMKMENNIEADRAGTVKEIKVSKGSAVMEGDVLITIE